MDFKRGTNRASRIITERSTWPSVEHNRESRAFLVRAHLVSSRPSLFLSLTLQSFWESVGEIFCSDSKATRIVFAPSWLCASRSLANCLSCLSFFFPPYFWKFYEVFCFVVRLHWSDMSVHSSSLMRTVSLILSFSLPLCWWQFETLIPIITSIGCRFASKKRAFTGETLCVFVVVCLTPSASFC